MKGVFNVIVMLLHLFIAFSFFFGHIKLPENRAERQAEVLHINMRQLTFPCLNSLLILHINNPKSAVVQK